MEYIYLGKIVNTHGIKGEIRLTCSFDKKELVFKKGFNIYIGKEHKKEVINSYRVHKNYDMITLLGINDINDVLKYKGFPVYINREDLKLKDTDFLLSDLVGLFVFSKESSYGEVIDIMQSKASHLLQVKNNDKIYYIPYIEEFVKNVDIKSKRIEVERVNEFYEI